MNIFFNPIGKGTNNNNPFLDHIAGVFLALLFLAGIAIIAVHIRVVPSPAEEPVEVISPAFSIIEEVALSYGIPVSPMERLADYLRDNGFNEKYGGVGLFSVKPSHLGWLKDSVLADTKIDLEDELQNAQAAAYILKRFYDSGYSWENCFLMYVFGVSEVNAGDRHLDFISYLFGE